MAAPQVPRYQVTAADDGGNREEELPEAMLSSSVVWAIQVELLAALGGDLAGGCDMYDHLFTALIARRDIDVLAHCEDEGQFWKGDCWRPMFML
jgi:hypothetical protein